MSEPEDVTEPTLWKKNGWIAKVIKNEDDEGWAVEMTRIGDSEPALVGPWTMGRDKKNPKPLNPKDFSTLVKTASEFLERSVQHARAQLHKTITIADPRPSASTAGGGARVRVDLDIVPDESDPHGVLRAFDDATDAEQGEKRVSAGFKLTSSTAADFVQGL